MAKLGILQHGSAVFDAADQQGTTQHSTYPEVLKEKLKLWSISFSFLSTIHPPHTLFLPLTVSFYPCLSTFFESTSLPLSDKYISFNSEPIPVDEKGHRYPLVYCLLHAVRTLRQVSSS